MFPQLIDFGGDQAEIFGDEWEVSEYLLETLKKFVTGGLNPLAIDRSLLFGGDGPVGFEAAEVIEPNRVVKRERTTDTRDPPVEASFAQCTPFVKRIAPTLAGLREIIRGHAGDANRTPLFIELEDLGVRPYIGAVVADEDGYVAEDADLSLVAIAFESAPLVVEEELDGLLYGEFAAIPIERRCQRIVLPLCELGGPFVPTCVVVLPTQHVEHGVIGQPGDVVLAKLLEAGALVVWRTIEKIPCGFLDQRQLQTGCAFEVGRPVMARQPGDALPCDQAVLRETFQADEQRIACEGGECGVR